jgi:hypothetical protein
MVIFLTCATLSLYSLNIDPMLTSAAKLLPLRYACFTAGSENNAKLISALCNCCQQFQLHRPDFGAKKH